MTYSRIIIHVEGQTEETFVNDVLRPYLSGVGYYRTAARLMGNPRLRRQRGGVKQWEVVLRDVVRNLKEDPGTCVGILVDYYGLPESWPGRSGLATTTPVAQAQAVRDALRQAVAYEMGDGFDMARIIPCITMHEFEGLLFSDPMRFATAIGHPHLGYDFQAVRDLFPTPEHINDSPHTAPSRRIQALVPEYQKPLNGVQAAKAIGLNAMRSECKAFGQWITELENSSAPPG